MIHNTESLIYEIMKEINENLNEVSIKSLDILFSFSMMLLSLVTIMHDYF